ncbi:hypothetical protein ACQPZF_16860 [Actinosynnema sp. CS-041913]|uniref:hypothetical protein n=1 Tax=Actinosynnema sp. CS-041913 TaxID=3239917 RepID=UPI003D8E6E5A
MADDRHLQRLHRDREVAVEVARRVRRAVGRVVLRVVLHDHERGAAMRLYESEMGLAGFTLCLVGGYTGARWGELVGQERHDHDLRAIDVRYPLKEVNGRLMKAGSIAASSTPTARPDVPYVTPRRSRGKRGRTKTPAGTRWLRLPPSITVFYESLLDGQPGSFAFTPPEGGLRRGNFRQRFWRPAWDGRKPDRPEVAGHVPPILPWFTFREARHIHATWMAEDGIPEVARRARLGQKMKGIARTYDHVTEVMLIQINDSLERRRAASLLALHRDERDRIIGWFPTWRDRGGGGTNATVTIAVSSPLILHDMQEARPQD